MILDVIHKCNYTELSPLITRLNSCYEVHQKHASLHRVDIRDQVAVRYVAVN